MSKIKRDGVRREKVYNTKDGYKAVIELSWNNDKLSSVFKKYRAGYLVFIKGSEIYKYIKNSRIAKLMTIDNYWNINTTDKDREEIFAEYEKSLYYKLYNIKLLLDILIFGDNHQPIYWDINLHDFGEFYLLELDVSGNFLRKDYIIHLLNKISKAVKSIEKEMTADKIYPKIKKKKYKNR